MTETKTFDGIIKASDKESEASTTTWDSETLPLTELDFHGLEMPNGKWSRKPMCSSAKTGMVQWIYHFGHSDKENPEHVSKSGGPLCHRVQELFLQARIPIQSFVA